MSKAIVRNAKAITMITNTLLNAQDDYMVGNPEWSTGTQSSIVLEIKSLTLNLPLIVVEIKYKVGHLFMKRLINYNPWALLFSSFVPILYLIVSLKL